MSTTYRPGPDANPQRAGLAEAPLPPSDAEILAQRLAAKLGLPAAPSDRELAALVQDGLGIACVAKLRESGLTDQELFALILPRRTYSHRKSNRENLSPDESDRAVRVARIAALAERVFGDGDRALAWLRAPKRALNNAAPLAAIATEIGARLVEDMLYRIDDGFFA